MKSQVFDLQYHQTIGPHCGYTGNNINSIMLSARLKRKAEKSELKKI